MADKKLTAKLALDNSEFKRGLKESESSLLGFKGSILGMATGVTILGGAFALLVGYLKSTDQGARVMTTGLRMARTALVDLITTQKLNLGNLVASRRIAKEENNLREGNRIDLVKEAELQRDLNKLRFDAAGQTKTDAQRIVILNDALKKYNELIDYKIKDQKEELLNLQKRLTLDINNTKLLDEEAKRKAELISLEAERFGEIRRVQSMMTGMMQAETEHMKDLAKAQADALARLKEANTIARVNPFRGESFYGAVQPGIKGGGLARGGRDLAGAPGYTEPVTDMTRALQAQSEAVGILSSSFAQLFSSTGEGFKGMINEMIAGLERLVAELMARAVVFGVLTLISGGGGGLADIARNLLGGRSLGQFVGGVGATSGAVSMGSVAPIASNLNINFTGGISGRDWKLMQQRNG